MDILEKSALFVWVVLCMISSAQAQGSNELCQFSPNSGARGTILFIENIREDLPQGTSVTHLQVNGNDNQISLWSDDHEYFTFDPASRNITVASSIVHREIGYRLTVYCRVINPNSDQVHELRVEIRTLDLNDHAPQFVNAPYLTNISELAPVGTTLISSISATDEDSSNPFVFYSVLPGPFSDHFEFPLPAQGKLVVKKMVDFEEVQWIELNIQATDNHPNIPNVVHTQLSATATVTIQVFDENDQNPVFTQSTFEATMTETDEIGTVIRTVPSISAYNPDIWQNSTLIYDIIEDPTSDATTYFSINPANGELTLARDGSERGTQLSFLIKVSKLGLEDRYSQALIRIHVQAANENEPRFVPAHYDATLVENTLIGSPVVRVSAIDNDEATELRYYFAEDYEEFAIDSQTGAITTAQELDFEEHERFTLIVRATDGVYSAEADVDISVVNINNHNPAFTRSYYTLSSNDIEKDQNLLQVQATDADRYSSITYSFLNNASYANFSIHAQTGEVTCLTDDVQQSSLVVIARDNGNPPRVDSCLIVIQGTQTTPGTGASKKEGGSSNMGAVIALSVLLIALIITIVVLGIYIFRRYVLHEFTDFIPTTIDLHNCASPDCPYCHENNRTVSPPNVALVSYSSSKQKPQPHRLSIEKCNQPGFRSSSQSQSRCVRSQSFEQNQMNFSSKNYKSYVDPIQPHKPNERHLQLYNGVALDDATSTQENPFSSQRSLEERAGFRQSPYANVSRLPSHTAAVNAGMYPQRYPLDDATVGSSSDRRSGSTLPHDYNDNMQVAQIEYDYAVSPLDTDPRRMNAFHSGYNEDYGASDMQGSPQSSMRSDHSYNHGELTSFKVGSTTQLVPSNSALPKSSRSLNKGSGNISFVDNSPSNSMYSSLTSQQSGLAPETAEHHKPGHITVYY